jgi:D-alanyl-D-alanine carboxypeptidase
MPNLPQYPDSIRDILASLDISTEAIASRSLMFHPEAGEVVIAEVEPGGREHWLTPAAAESWKRMSSAARADGIEIRIVSAFRSVARQAEIIRAKLDQGQPLDSILCVNAPPGFSEHHTGRAIDITTGGVAPLEREFETTAAFEWLSKNAGHFGFVLSFPDSNEQGFDYEPWHWCYSQSLA